GLVDLAIFLAALMGTSVVVASGCVFNFCIDHDIEIKMERTKNRELVQGLISQNLALNFATGLGVAGVARLYQVATPRAAMFAVIG
ncbi:UbiA family prenyltransferase, partial [Pseudomonas marginalis]|uniref:UbiA family prenyltransferase n=1 Tax=Pseudomonas marginalis TaxID=298 RepID=UPI0034D56347